MAVRQYRRLAAVLQERSSDRRLKSLLITSALPGEGKTLTAANLALTLSGSCAQRVLLIDADFRRPSIHRVFRIPNTTGLVDALQSEGSDVSLTNVTENLNCTDGRPSNPDAVAALTSDRMQDLVDQFATQFDWVLLDAPEAAAVHDIRLLARIAGAVLMVIRAESTSRRDVQRAIDQIGADFVVGTVLNRVAARQILDAGPQSEPPRAMVSTRSAVISGSYTEKS